MPILLFFLLASIASAQDTTSLDWSAIGHNFLTMGLAVTAATQFIKTHFIKAIKPDVNKWVVIAAAFAVSGLLTLVAHETGGVTDPMFSMIQPDWLKLTCYAFAGGLAGGGYHGFASGFAQNAGKAIAAFQERAKAKEAAKEAEKK